MADVPMTPVRQQISREVRRALSASGLSARAAAIRMEVEPKTLYRWLNGEVTAPMDQLARFAEIVGPVRLELGGQTKEAAPPKWAERLSDQILDEVRINRAVVSAALAGLDPDRVNQILARLEAELGPRAR